MHMWPIPEPRDPRPELRAHSPPRPKHNKSQMKGVPGSPPPLSHMRGGPGTAPLSRTGPGGPPVLDHLGRGPPGSRHSKSKVRGWMKEANKLFSTKDKYGKLNLLTLPPLFEVANKMPKESTVTAIAFRHGLL
jgi:hypothetical protein